MRVLVILHLCPLCCAPWNFDFAHWRLPPIRCVFLCDTLVWATGTHVGAGDHAIELFCIGYGRVLGFCTLLH